MLKLTQNICLTSIFAGVDVNQLQDPSVTTVVFLDGTPNAEEIRALLVLGKTVLVRDHHLDSKDLERFNTAKTLLGANARILKRSEMPACPLMVRLGEYAGSDFMIVADSDLDGFFSAMKAKGYSYPYLDTDAAILDGPPEHKTAQNLSAQGWYFLQAYRGAKYLQAEAQFFHAVFQQLNPQTKAPAMQLASDTLDKFLAIQQSLLVHTQYLAESAVEINPNIWFVDTTTTTTAFDESVLCQLLESKPGCKIAVIKTTRGKVATHFGYQYNLTLPGSQQGKLNLTNIIDIPEEQNRAEAGVFAKVPFKLVCNETWWNSIYKSLYRNFFN